jgi:hypothetical protein
VKKHMTFILAGAALPLVALAAAYSQADAEPKSVPGSINRGAAAVVKPGYTFVRRQHQVDVVKVGGPKTGTYTCSCPGGQASKKCELLFSAKQIMCKEGSCEGVICRLVPVEATAER